MEETELNRRFGEFEDSDVMKLDIDVFGNRVLIETIVDTAGSKSIHNVEFQEVAAIVYAYGAGRSRFDLEPSSGVIWTSCLYYPTGVGQARLRSDISLSADQFTSMPNFSLGLHGSGLFIEASRVVIDGELFDVGFPDTKI